jgi:WD40 repeat protein
MVVNVWNFKTRFKVASNKIACKVRGISFSRDGSYFVTVGNRHVKFWYLTTSLLMETVPLRGRAAILADYKNNYFCDVVCGSDECTQFTYAITTNGILCQFNENRCLSNTTDLRSERAYCLYADNSSLFVGCSNGNIHIFQQKTLEFIASLPRPHYLGVDLLKGLDMSHVFETLNRNELKYPDCIAVCYDKYTNIVTAVYNDHSLYVWDINDLNAVKKIDSHLFHSSCCWSFDVFTQQSSSASNIANDNNNNILPNNCFITCSTDNTLRIWSMNGGNQNNNNSTSFSLNNKLKSNIYSKELLKIIYIDNDLSGLCEIDQSLTSSENDVGLIQIGSITNNLVGGSSSTSNSNSNFGNSQTMSTNINNQIDSKIGARCLKINPFGKTFLNLYMKIIENSER